MTPAGDDGGAERLEHALAIAFRRLARRDRTVAEIRRHLEARGVDCATVDAVVAELLAGGYVDDARYAQRFAEDRRTIDAWGAQRIRERLLADGVAPEHVDAALGERHVAEELEAAVAVLRRRLRLAPADDRERERALGLLVRRGYDLELAYDAVRALERAA